MTAAARRILVVVVTVLALGLSVRADVPWKQNDDDAVTPATLDELKADLGQPRYNRIVDQVQSKVTLAEKAMEPYYKEMGKPVEKRRTALLEKCKMRSAQMYEAAAKLARRIQLQLQKKSHQACIKKQFEQPNRDKAAKLYLELSVDAQAGGNITQAALLCKKALAADPANEQAKSLFRQLAEEYQQAMRDRKNRSRSVGGGSDEDDGDRGWDGRDWRDWDGLRGRGSRY